MQSNAQKQLSFLRVSCAAKFGGQDAAAADEPRETEAVMLKGFVAA